MMAQRRLDLIFKQAAVDGGTILRGARRRGSALYHKTGDEPVEWTAIVLSAGSQGEKVVCGLGTGLAEKFKLDVAV